MDTFNRFKQLMNGRKVRYCENDLKAMWDDWHCKHEIFKLTVSELGMKKPDRVRLNKVMHELGIKEVVNLEGSSNRFRAEYFTNETAHLFAVKQNNIVKSKHFGRV